MPARALMPGRSAWTGRAIVAFLTVASVPGITRLVAIHFVREKPWQLRSVLLPHGATLDGLYAGLIADLPAGARLGYVSDLMPPDGYGTALYLQTRYVLAPRVVLPGADEERVVARLADPEKLARICAEHKLRAIKIYPGGIALLARKEP